MALFKRKHISLILAGRKTQTRRIHRYEWHVGRCYGIRDRWFDKPKCHIIITRKFKQRIGDISEVDVQKEGYSNLEEFKQIWTKINRSWNKDQVVTVYEFKLYSKTGNFCLQRHSNNFKQFCTFRRG